MEKAKAFFLICAGILMLTVALHLTTDTAQADFDLNATGPIVGLDGSIVLLRTGEVWAIPIAGEPTWIRYEFLDPPISIEEIQLWHSDVIVTIDGITWINNLDGEWSNVGVPPGTSAQSTDWSQLKDSYGK